MIKLSAIILTNQADKIIDNCLQTLSWVDERILVNTGNDSQSIKKRAQKYQCRVIKGSKEYNFANWRNEGAHNALGEWLLYIDHDERVSDKLRTEIQDIISHVSPDTFAYQIPRKNYFWGKNFKSSWPDYQLRLIKKTHFIKWQGKIHELPQIKGAVSKLKNPLIHFSHKNLESCIANTLEWSKLEALNRFNDYHPKMTGFRFIKIIIYGFIDQFVKKKVWKEGTEGVIEGIYQVFSLYFTYFRLWEMQRKEPLSSTYQNIDKNLNK